MRTPDGKTVGGVALDVGKFVAAKLGVSFELVAYTNADAYTQSFGKGEWDIAIGPPTPLVAEKADFGPDLVLIDFMYVAAPGREFANAAQVDRPGVKIGVGRNSTADQFLSRTLKSAELVRPGPEGSRRYVAAKQMYGRRTLSTSKGSPMRSPGQRLYRGRSQPSGTRWRFRKEDLLRRRPNSPRSPTRQRKPVWCERLSNSQG
jgi:hypothetical protein